MPTRSRFCRGSASASPATPATSLRCTPEAWEALRRHLNVASNDDVIANLNRQYVISVNIVPNTWEEYTIAASPSTTAP